MRIPFASHRFGNLGELGAFEIHAERMMPASCCSILTKSKESLLKDDLNHRSSSFHLRQKIAKGKHRVPAVAESAIVCRPGYASCAPKALGEALAIDAHENEPKSLDPCRTDMPRQPYDRCSGVSEEQRVIRSESLSVLARNSGRMGLISGPLST